MVENSVSQAELHILCQSDIRVLSKLSTILMRPPFDLIHISCIKTKSYLSLRPDCEDVSETLLISFAEAISAETKRFVFFTFKTKFRFTFLAFKNGVSLLSLRSEYKDRQHEIVFNHTDNWESSLNSPVFSFENFEKKMRVAIKYGNPMDKIYEVLGFRCPFFAFPDGYEINLKKSDSKISYYVEKPWIPPERIRFDEMDASFIDFCMISKILILPNFEINWYGQIDDNKKQYGIVKSEDGHYWCDNRLYIVRRDDGSIDLLSSPEKSSAQYYVDLKVIESIRENWNGDIVDLWDIFGIDKSGLVYAEKNHDVYVIDVTQHKYAKFHLMGEMSAWYLNTKGDMHVITNNLGFDRNRGNNIVRFYRFVNQRDSLTQ